MKRIQLIIVFLVSITACHGQSLGDRLSNYLEYLSSSNDISMVIDVTMKDEKDIILETSRMEYLKSGNNISTRMGDKLFLFDQTNSITLGIDLKTESINIGETTTSDIVSDQLKTIIRMFDEGKDLFEVKEVKENNKFLFEVFVKSEIFVSYTFAKNDRLEKVIFYKNNPQSIDGKMVSPKLYMGFSYNSGLKIPGVLEYLHLKEGRWQPRQKYRRFDFHDGLTYNSNE